MENIPPEKSLRVFDKVKGGEEDETETVCIFVCVRVYASLRLICIWCVLLSGPNEGVHV